MFDPRADSNRLCFKTIRLILGVLDMSDKADLNISISESIRKRKMLDPAYVYSYAYFGPVFETVVRKRFVFFFLDFLALQKRICIFWQMLSQ